MTLSPNRTILRLSLVNHRRFAIVERFDRDPVFAGYDATAAFLDWQIVYRHLDDWSGTILMPFRQHIVAIEGDGCLIQTSAKLM